VPVQAQGYDPARPYVARAQRPTEWAVVGLLGQLPVRFTGEVKQGDYLVGSTAGAGEAAAGVETRVQVMEIREPFDAGRGYGVADCFIDR
jgi:hypothetical protein